MTALNRRRFLNIAAAAVVVPKAALAVQMATWRGTALGAAAQMRIAGLAQRDAGILFERVQAEIERLENIFSLYRPKSSLVLLNAGGSLMSPPPEFLEILSLSASLHAATGGAFDPSVQPLWQVFSQAGGEPDASSVEAARALTGWEKISFDSDAVRFAQTGMGLTLNGIAQGYVADRVSALLSREGLCNVVVDMGEIRAAGERPGGGAWRVGIGAPGQEEPLVRLGLTDRALATSAPMGTRIGASAAGHILDPRTGQPGAKWVLASVSAPTAAVADGLSTAFCLMDREDIDDALKVFDGARIEYLGTEKTL